MNLDSLTPSFIFPEHFCIVNVEGSNAASFLHRLSTNHILGLSLQEACLSAFLDQKGRIENVGYIYRRESALFQIIVPYACTRSLLEWLDQYLFAEDVSLNDVTSEFKLAWVIGGDALKIKGPVFRFVGKKIDSHFKLMLKDKRTDFQDEMYRQGLRKLDADEFESLRIAGGVPFSAHELNPNFNPLQLGLSELIHWAKGCYIGQEVISRLESHNQDANALIPVCVAQGELSRLTVGELVRVEGKPAGHLTSVASQTIKGEANALIVLKRAFNFEHGLTELSNVRLDRQR